MADSDDEYDRKRRDKFRGERTEYGGRESRRDDRRREDWIERDSWSRSRTRSDYRDYRGGGRDRYSPAHSHDISPPVKRMRTDWEDRRYGHESGYSTYGSWSHEGYGGHSTYTGGGSHSAIIRDAEGQTQPPMMSFKSFLQTQDDNITDEDAMRKYNEYKLEFRRQQLNEFFVAHKDEEWFKIKYHPEDSVKRRDELTAALKNRVAVFLEFLEGGKYDEVTVDADQTDQIIKLLDAVVIRFEGGSDFDMQALNEQPPPPSVDGPASVGGQTGAAAETDNISTATDDEGPTSVPAAKSTVDEEEVKKESPKAKVEDDEEDKETPPAPVEEVEVPSKGKHRRREYESDSNSESGEETDEPAPPGEKVPEETPVEKEKEPDEEEGEAEKKEQPPTPPPPKVQENGEKEEGESTKVDEETSDGGQKQAEDAQSEKSEKSVKSVKSGKSVKAEEQVPKPRALHRTASIFLRSLAPSITKLEVEAMCKRYPGFLRVAIADPQPERRWFRRGWVTFEREVNIKEICWSINNIRLRDCELGAIVNRDLSRRIRTVSGITSHKQVVRHDIKLCARIIHNMDRKWSLWGSESEQMADPESSIQSFGMASHNPVLHNITDYLIEEASAEEEELLGHSTDQEEGQVSDDGATVERDDELIKVLDRLLFYLRIVHSVDYYNHSEYPNEDEMPNRCGIMHARGIPPSSKVTQHEVSEYCKTFEQKIASFLQTPIKLADEDCSKLGLKEPEIEVEKFIQANTQELAKDKWLCPLSGKKFKGPEFVKKHIFNKHGEKIEEVKKEVEYYNNYLRDPKRPQLPEHPGSRTQRKDNVSSVTERDPYSATAYAGYGYAGYGGGRHAGAYSNSFGGYSRDVYNRDAYTRDAYSRPQRSQYNRGRQDYRPVVQYRDLDAPRETEDF